MTIATTPPERTPARLYYDADADLDRLRGRRIAVIGFGSQGHAHALNLADSGLDVVVGLRPGSPRRALAERAGLAVASPAEAARDAAVVALLAPDPDHGAVFAAGLRDALGPGRTLVLAHGFSLRYGALVPPPGTDVVLVAPKSPGHRLREVFQAGGGVPALVAVAQDGSGRALDDALAYARGLGCTRAGVLLTSVAEETETDLFGEQAVLCGGVTALVTAGFETLVEEGYQPEVAYFECLHELKLIVDLMYHGGLAAMRHSVSDTAEFGDCVAGPRLVDAGVRARMRDLLAEIRDGRFAAAWRAECEAGQPVLRRERARLAAHPLEEVGRRLRARMPFLAGPDAGLP
jgi:ketol-acid reductoisomerase